MRFRMGKDCGHEGFPGALFAMDFGGGRGWTKGWSWGGDFGDGGGRGRGRRGRGRMFTGDELRLLLLRLIADEPRHGYDLIRAIEEISHGAYAPSPGVVYPTLTMLQDMGLIEEAKSEGARKAFAATKDGEAHLEEQEEEVEALLVRLKELGSDNRKAGGAPIKRSVASLLSALWHRVTREDADEEVMHKIAAILDEAAQKIERLT